jgi:hypothetical protein
VVGGRGRGEGAAGGGGCAWRLAAEGVAAAGAHGGRRLRVWRWRAHVEAGGAARRTRWPAVRAGVCRGGEGPGQGSVEAGPRAGRRVAGRSGRVSGGGRDGDETG